MTNLNTLFKVAGIKTQDYPLNPVQMTLLHQAFKTQLLTTGYIKLDLENRDQLWLGLERGNWSNIGELVVISFSHGDYSPGYFDDGQAAWMASGTCYFPVDQIDTAVLYLLSMVTERDGPYRRSSANIQVYNLEHCRTVYDNDAELKQLSEEMFTKAYSFKVADLLKEVERIGKLLTGESERGDPNSIRLAMLRNDLQRAINEIDCIMPPNLHEEVSNAISST